MKKTAVDLESDEDFFEEEEEDLQSTPSFDPYYNNEDIFFSDSPYYLSDEENILWIQKFKPTFFCLIRT
ncbi:MAG: hypothetical protein ACXW07_09165 [Nitrososphaeraceae archaeon]